MEKDQPIPTIYGSDSLSDADDRELAALGKKPVLRRNFYPLSILGVSCMIMVTWEGLLSVFTFGLLNGGPGGLIYGFLFCWLGWGAVVATMAELVSIWPTAGGQYHWTYHLAPEEWRVFLSYVTGWQSTITWQALSASGGYLTATTLQGLVINGDPSYVPARWHGTLMVFAVMALALIINIFLAKVLPHIETVALWTHITLFIVVITVVTVMSPTKSSNADVWTLFSNGGGYESKGLSFFVGLITPVFAFSGADGAVHMSEEIRHCSRVLPWALMGSILINGVMGFGFLIAILYCIGDIESALHTPTGYPFIEIMTQATSSVVGGTALSALVVSMYVMATMNVVATASRQLWAFSRDNAVPNAPFISYVHPKLKVPVVSIAVTVTVSCLLSLINIGSATVLNAVVSVTVAGFFGSYLLPFGLFLHARVTQPERVKPGPWSLGRWGPFVTASALLWSALIMFFSFWPTTLPVTGLNMNWSCVIWGAVMMFAVVFWGVHGRRVYTGPVIETVVT